jgi:hypothetical protein
MPNHDEELDPANFTPQHCVMIRVPELGFGPDMDAMIEFYWERDEAMCTGYLRTTTYPRDWIYFWFSDAKKAENFAVRFGAQILSPAEVSLFFIPVNRQGRSQ